MLTGIRKFHKLIGITLMLPFAGWVVTGFVFFIKPGYTGAYETLMVRTYPLEESVVVGPDSTWREFRYLRTILGDHLIVRTDKGWRHLDPANMQPMPDPMVEEIKDIVSEAIEANPERYGSISEVNGNIITTSTGVEITLDWNRLSLHQRGKDTDRIDMLYRIHYLQWTGIGIIDKVLGFLGLALVAALTLLGARLAISSGRDQRP